jgi:ABC-type phosphonate transport system, ATPase component
MRTSPIQSYSAQLRTTPPRVMTFPADADPAAALVKARRWAEDQARAFLEEHSLPQNPWEAGTVFAGEAEQGSSAKALAMLTIYTSEGEYVFEWDDQG